MRKKGLEPSLPCAGTSSWASGCASEVRLRSVSDPPWPAHGGRVDRGPELTAQQFVDWCAEHGVVPPYIQPGKPDRTDIERFNRSYRTEVLNAHLLESPNCARGRISGCVSTTRSGRTTASAGCRP